MLRLIIKLLLQQHSFLLLLLDCELLSFLLLELDYALADLVAVVSVELVVHNTLQNNRPYIVNLRVGEQLKSRCEIHKLTVVWVVVPAEDGDAVLRLKLVAVR